MRIGVLYIILFLSMLSAANLAALSDSGEKQSAGQAQQEDSHSQQALSPVRLPEKPVAFARDDDSIMNSAAMTHFFAALDSLQSDRDMTVDIVQIGDSHIQAGYVPGAVRHGLQNAFGNAGRGFIAPLRLSGTNEPDDYVIAASQGIEEIVMDKSKWQTGRLTKLSSIPEVHPGIGGLAVRTRSDDFSLTVSIPDNISTQSGPDYSFARAILYRGANSLRLESRYADSKVVADHYAEEDSPLAATEDSAFDGVIADTFSFVSPVKSLKLHCAEDDRANTAPRIIENDYYGFCLTNGQPGILYSSIGLNGACYANYARADYYRQLALLHPALIIVSLGTNETFCTKFDRKGLEDNIRRTISFIREFIPDAEILLTTPPGCYVKRTGRTKRRHRYTYYVENPYTANAVSAIKKIASEENVAVWDLFNATGGSNSCESWYKAGLMQKNRSHYTVRGYEIQGELLYRALIKSYDCHLKAAASKAPSSPMQPAASK